MPPKPPAERDKLTEAILGAAFEVSNTLGHGFLEAVYRRALAYEIGLRGLECDQEVSFGVNYKGECVGQYVADLVVERLVVVELKAVEILTPAHGGQVINYLRASRLRVGLLLNFGTPRLQYRRFALTEGQEYADERR